jgi:hypothetical protein
VRAHASSTHPLPGRTVGEIQAEAISSIMAAQTNVLRDVMTATPSFLDMFVSMLKMAAPGCSHPAVSRARTGSSRTSFGYADLSDDKRQDIL